MTATDRVKKRVTITVPVTGTDTIVAEVPDDFDLTKESVWKLIHSGDSDRVHSETEFSGQPEWRVERLIDPVAALAEASMADPTGVKTSTAHCLDWAAEEPESEHDRAVLEVTRRLRRIAELQREIEQLKKEANAWVKGRLTMAEYGQLTAVVLKYDIGDKPLETAVQYVVLTGGEGQPGWFYGSNGPSLDKAIKAAQRLATESRETAMVVVVHAYVSPDGSVDRLEQSERFEQAEGADV